MSTSPIRLRITAGQEYEAAFAAAEARVRSFGASGGAAGERMQKSFEGARGTAAILSSELGLGLDRHLRAVLATSEILGPALSTAFPVAAAIGFGVAAYAVGQKLADLVHGSEKLKEVFDRLQAAGQQLVGLQEETNKFNEAARNAGVSAQQKWAQTLDETNAKLARQREHVRALSDTIFDLEKGGLRSTVGGNTAEDLPDLRAKYAIAVEEEAKLVAQRRAAQAELAVAQRTAAEEYKKIVEAAAKLQEATAARLQEKFDAILEKFKTFIPQTGSPELLSAGVKQNPLISSDYPGLQDPWAPIGIAIEQMQVAPEVIEKVKAHLEALRRELDYNRAAWGSFGHEIGQALGAGILFGQSWKGVLESVLVSILQLIVKMTILKELQSSAFGKTASGGFLGALIGGLTGLAGGGPVSAGSAYLVGERGPELFWPNTSGSIIPNSAGVGGQVIYQDFRGAVVSDDLLRRADGATMMQQVHARSVADARAAVSEDFKRGRTPWR